MKELARTISNQGHGKTGYLIEMSEIEVIALQKYLSGRRLNKGCPLDLAVNGLEKHFSKVKTNVSVERLADLLNPRLNHKKD